MALLLLWEPLQGLSGHNLKSDPVLEQPAESSGLPRAEQSPLWCSPLPAPSLLSLIASLPNFRS